MSVFNANNTVKNIVTKQYRDIANSSLSSHSPKVPKEGWIRVIRKALGMSGSQLASRLGLSRNRVSVLERNEVDGKITLKQLNEIAEQLNCELRYALVPKKPVEEILEDRAMDIASEYLDTNTQNMFLEAQHTDEKAQSRLLKEMQQQILVSGGRVLWRDN